MKRVYLRPAYEGASETRNGCHIEGHTLAEEYAKLGESGPWSIWYDEEDMVDRFTERHERGVLKGS